MQKTTISLLFVFFCGISYSQEKKLVWTEKTCEDGIEKASKHASQGYYFCESRRLTTYKNPDFTEFYEKYLESNYKIICGNGGCIMTDYRKCYEDKMEKLILEKFGADIFEKSLKEARELYAQKKY